MKRLAPIAVALSLLAGCAAAPLPRPDPPPAGELELPELVPVHQALRDACGPVQPDGTVVCEAAKLEAVDHAAVELYHDGRQSQAVARAERRHRQIDGGAYEVALDERDALLEAGGWDWLRGFVSGVAGGAAAVGGAWGAHELTR